jgi:hypothetical protein
MYKQYKDADGAINQSAIIRTTDMVCIPFDPDNTDYQIYLKWVAEGNTPEPAENT